MSNDAPTDALRLVPVEPTWDQLVAMRDCCAELSGIEADSETMLTALYRAALKAAPASPLPEGGDWIDGTPEVPVGSPTWCGWASYEIRRLRSALPAAPTGEPK